MTPISQIRKGLAPDIGHRQANDMGSWGKLEKAVRKAESSSTIALFFRKVYRLLQDIPGSIRLFQLGGFVGQNKRVTPDMQVNSRVNAVKMSQQTGHSRVERVVVTRLNPLKAMQVVDFPDIEENKGAIDGTDFTDRKAVEWRNMAEGGWKAAGGECMRTEYSPSPCPSPPGEGGPLQTLDAIPYGLAVHGRGGSGAGEGNRTLVASLEDWNSTIELHPQTEVILTPMRGLSIHRFAAACNNTAFWVIKTHMHPIMRTIVPLLLACGAADRSGP